MRVHIDTSDLTLRYAMSRSEANAIGQRAVEAAIARVYEKTYRSANENLNRTKDEYLSNLQRPSVGRLKASITLTGQLPNMVEQGAQAFDMKKGMLNSPKAKLTKDGRRYLIIPFRWATPSAQGGGAAFSGRMPTEIYKVMRTLRTTRTSYQGQHQSGQGLKKQSLAGGTYGKLKTRARVTGGQLTEQQRKAYEHKAPLLQGMVRSQKVYEKATQGQYHTFRVVSEAGVSPTGKRLGSEPNSWIHRGIEARNFMTNAVKEAEIGLLTENIVAEALNEMGL